MAASEQALRDLVQLSQAAGRDLFVTQGAGGNTSVKSDDGARMWIKASGVRLSAVTERGGVTTLPQGPFLELLRDPDLHRLPTGEAHDRFVERQLLLADPGPPLRPSLESGMHALLDRVVLHVHPVYVNAFTSMEGGRAALAGALGRASAWAPYESPGWSLTQAIAAVVQDHEARGMASPSEILLENHGVILSGGSVAEVLEGLERVLAAGEAHFGALEPEVREQGPPGASLQRAQDEAAKAARLRAVPLEVRAARLHALNDAAREPGRWYPACPLGPDDVVYGVHEVRTLEGSLSAWLEHEWPETSKWILVLPGVGVLLAAKSASMLDMMEENLFANVMVRRLIDRVGRARPLPHDDVLHLLGMDSEAYRQQVAERAARGESI